MYTKSGGKMKTLIRIILEQLLIFSLLLIAPVLYIVVPIIALAVTSDGDLLGGLAFVYLLFGPLVASFWMVITRMYSRHQRLTADGSPYHSSFKGMFIACGWMIAGLLLSAVFEFLFVWVFHFPKTGDTIGWILWFTAAPFTAFSPVFLGWILRDPWRNWLKNREWDNNMKIMAEIGGECREGSVTWNWRIQHGYTPKPWID